MDGVVVIDKEEGWTSHDVVAKFRGIAKTRRVGHLGTLDPMATGVLPLAVGVATRLARFYTQAEKVYEGIVRFGFSTDTYDRTGTPASAQMAVALTPNQLEEALAMFRGTIRQVPPQYSAKKVAGVPAYKSARQNIAVELAPAEITIHELTVLQIDGERVTLRVRCSAGTYIRSLAHDLGAALGCGAHLDALRRLASGEFTLEQSQPISAPDLASSLISLGQLLPRFPPFVVDEQLAVQIRQGRSFRATGFEEGHVRAVSAGGDLLAVCERVAPSSYHPSVVVG